MEERDVDLDVLLGPRSLELAEADGDVAARSVPQVRRRRGGGQMRFGGRAILGGSGELEGNLAQG